MIGLYQFLLFLKMIGCEEGFRKEIKKYFPNTPLLRFRNHLQGNIKDLTMKHGDNANDVQSVRNILLQIELKLVDKKIKRSKTGYTSISGQEYE